MPLTWASIIPPAATLSRAIAPRRDVTPEIKGKDSNLDKWVFRGDPRWLRDKESACSAGEARDMGLIPLEEEMAAHSSILAWRIPWTEEPGGLVHGVAKSQA